MQETSVTVKIPTAFLCPISEEIMSNPVVAEDGETYEKEEIEKYFAKKEAAAQNPQSDLKGAIPREPVKITSPLHGTDMGRKLTPNLGIFRQIKEFLEATPSLSKEAYFELGLLAETLNAIQSGNVGGLGRLIEKEKRLLEREIKDGKSLLEVVCQEGTPELLRVVIKAQKKLGQFELTDEKLTPLVLSCLVSMQKEGLKAFMMEANWPTDRWQQFFKVHLKEGGELRIIDAFVLYGHINLDQPLDDEKNTALHLAILNRQPWKVRRLIQLGADTTVENKEGLDAKRLAKKLNDRELLRNISQWKHEKRSEVTAKKMAALEGEVNQLRQELLSIAESKATKDLVKVVANENIQLKEQVRYLELRAGFFRNKRLNPKQQQRQDVFLKAISAGNNLATIMDLHHEGAMLIEPDSEGTYPLVAAVYAYFKYQESASVLNYIEECLGKDANIYWRMVELSKLEEKWQAEVGKLLEKTPYMANLSWLADWMNMSSLNFWYKDYVKKIKDILRTVQVEYYDTTGDIPQNRTVTVSVDWTRMKLEPYNNYRDRAWAAGYGGGKPGYNYEYNRQHSVPDLVWPSSSDHEKVVTELIKEIVEPLGIIKKRMEEKIAEAKSEVTYKP